MPAVKRQLTITDIFKYLPHRYPFLLVDRVLDYDPGQFLTGIKNVSINEPFFTGHFPDNPVMPGVLVIEALAQAGAILAHLSTHTSPQDSVFYLASLDNAKFKQIVRPGDQMVLEIKVMSHKKSFWKIAGQALVNDKIAASVEILSAMREIQP